MVAFRHDNPGCTSPVVRFVGEGEPRPRGGRARAADWQRADGTPFKPYEPATAVCPDCGAVLNVLNLNDLTEG